MKKTFLVVFLALFIFTIIIWWNWAGNISKILREETQNAKLSQKAEPAILTLAAVGDVVVHMPIVRSALNETTGDYDFRPIFSEVSDRLSKADLTVGVLETLINNSDRQYTGYPQFNSPAAIADALKWAGIDLVFTAHNHSLDMGTEGMERTLEYLNKIGLPYVGSLSNNREKRYRLINIKGINLAFLAYTTTTNGLKAPKGEEWVVNFFDYQKVTADIAEVKQAGADCIILALHTGIEYQRNPSSEQIKLTEWLIKSGVDIILGSHVHVVQPLEYRQYINPDNGDARDYFIAYSLGNVLSNQRWKYSDYGILLNLKLQKKSEGYGVKITQASYVPLWVHRYWDHGKYQYRIKTVTGPEYLGKELDVDKTARDRIREVWNETRELFNK